MKTVVLYIMCLVGCIPFLTGAAQELTGAAREKDSGFRVAYVSVNEAVEKTGEQEKIRIVLEKERKRIEGIIRKKSEALNEEAVKIRKEMTLLSEEEKVKKYESLQKMQITMEQFVKRKELEFQKKESSLRNTIIGRIKTVVSNVAGKEKVDVIRNKDGVLWVHPRVDLTNKVVSLYRKKYK